MRAALGGLVAAAAVVVMPAAPAAAASCAADSYGADDLPVAFLGTALQERNGFTRMSVEEVWRGPDLAPEVWVRTGQQQLEPDLMTTSSADAHLERGTQYVVGAEDADLWADACSVSLPEEATRPATVREPVTGGATGATPVEPPRATDDDDGRRAMAAGRVGAVLAVGLGLLAWRRRGRVVAGRR